jgi:putative ABC transport system permease protein
MYFPLLAGGPLRAFLVLRTEAGPEYVASAVRHEIHHLDPDQAVYQAITMRQLIARSIADRRSTLLLVGLFALLALVLSSVGLYGVIACFVRERVREIGIRMALGAERTQVLGLILLEGMKPCSVGLVIGGALAVACTRFLRSLLYETSPTDPLTLCAVAGGLLAVAALACLLPALRAAGLDPARALRNE